MNPPRRLRGTFGMCNLREGFVNLREGFVVAPWRLREAFSKTRSAKASRSPLEGFAKAPRAPSFGNDSSDNDKPPGVFLNKSPPPFTQFQVFSTQVLLAFVLTTCWVQHSHHTSTSPSSTLLLTRVCPPSIPPLFALGPTFSAAAVSLLCYRRHGGRGKRFRFVGVHHRQSMLLADLHCQTSSRTNQCHEGTLIHARTL